MARQALDSKLMRRALESLDRHVEQPTRLVIGGGAAMLLAYGYPLSTQDVDAFAAKGGASIAQLDNWTKRVARDLNIEPDWLNAHFETYTGVLPDDFATRLRRVQTGQSLVIDALGPEDLMVMKCFAGRDKDLPHVRRLFEAHDFDIELVDRHLSELVNRRYPKAQRAADFFDDLRDEYDR